LQGRTGGKAHFMSF